MKFLWCAVSLLPSVVCFQSGAKLQRNDQTNIASTRRWTLKEPNAEIDTLADDKVSMESQEQEEQVFREAVVQQEQEEEYNVPLSDLSPSEDEQVLSRDEQFMRMAIELAEEE